MFTGTLALLNRSLKSDDRQIRTHLFRLLFVGLTYGMLLSSQSMWAVFGAPGLNMFRQIAYLNFFCITLAALSVFACAITEEKEDMTLGLLKMAGVSPLALLLGKSTPRLVSAIVLLSAQLPFTMLAITLGGVSLQQVLATYFALLAYLVLVANLSLFFSVVMLRSRGASVMTTGVLAAYFFGPFIIGASKTGLIHQGYLIRGGVIDQVVDNVVLWVGSTSAFGRMRSILLTGFNEPVISFQVVSNLIAGAVLFLLAWIAFERCTRNEKPASDARGMLFKRIGHRGVLGPNRAWEAALTWKDFHFVAGGKMMILAKFVLYGAVLALIVYTSTQANARFRLRDFGTMTMMLGLWALMLEAGVQASRIFYTEVKWKTLSSIVMLPTSLGTIAYSKILGVLIALIPAASYFLLGVVLAPKEFGEAIEEIIDEPGFWYFTAQFFFFLHLAALLSLYVKWGAFPLAIGTIYVGNFVFFVVFSFGRGPEEALFVLMAFATVASCGVMQMLINMRLTTLAAQ